MITSLRFSCVRMVKEASARLYTSRLPVGPHGAGVTPGSPLYRGQVKMSRSAGGEPKLPREEQVQEIMELKKALAKTRQDLQKTRSRRQSQDNRSSSDEVSPLIGHCHDPLIGRISHTTGHSVAVICSKFFLCHSNNVWTMPGT